MSNFRYGALPWLVFWFTTTVLLSGSGLLILLITIGFIVVVVGSVVVEVFAIHVHLYEMIKRDKSVLVFQHENLHETK